MKFKDGVGGNIPKTYSDEYYTSLEQVKDCVERVVLDKSWKILCPFDTNNSEFVKYLLSKNYNVTYLKDGERNTDYKPEDYDIIITNPPWRSFTKLYSDYFDRCPRFIAILSWTILFHTEKDYTQNRISSRNFTTGKYRSKEPVIKFNATNSDKLISCFYLYKGFTTGTNIQPVVPLKI